MSPAKPKPAWSPADIVKPKRTIAVVELELAAVTADRDRLRQVVDELAAECAAAKAAVNAVAGAVPAMCELAIAKGAAEKPAAGRNLRIVLKPPTLAWLKEIAGVRQVTPAKAAEALLEDLAADDLAAHARAPQ